MQMRRHIHAWSLYTPALDLESTTYLGAVLNQVQWAHRRCDCGLRQRCLSARVLKYPEALRAYADEKWENVEEK